MTHYFTTTSFTLTWLTALALALAIAVGTGSLVAWFAFAFIGLMPALLLPGLTQTPAKTIAEILHDTESGRSS